MKNIEEKMKSAKFCVRVGGENLEPKTCMIKQSVCKTKICINAKLVE